MTDEQFGQLEKNILRDGKILSPLRAWKETNILIDGHHRLTIARKHGLNYRVEYFSYASRAEALKSAIDNQDGQRNMTDMQRIEVARRYEDAVRREAQEHSMANLKQNPEVVNLPPRDNGKSRDALGAIAGVSGSTYEHGVYAIEHAPEQVVDAARSGELSVNAAYTVAKMSPETQQEVVELIESGESPKSAVKQTKKPHVSYNSGQNEWYTPKVYIDAARHVMGDIDLDPASSDIANRTVRAHEFYTEQSNGLEHDWHGRIWMNPPYSSDKIGKFADKLVSEKSNIESAIVLVNNATETQWFKSMVSVSSAVCFPRGRVRFLDPDGNPAGAPLQGQAVLYAGEKPDLFAREFSQFGWVAIIA